jgi:hypothetical protein
MKFVSLMGVALLISGVAAASEPCAWVLWVQYDRIGVGDTKYERSVVPEAAYPYNGYQKCIEDAHTRAMRQVEGSKTADNVKRVEHDTLMGRKESVRTELKSVGTIWTTYMCFPHPVKPE